MLQCVQRVVTVTRIQTCCPARNTEKMVGQVPCVVCVFVDEVLPPAFLPFHVVQNYDTHCISGCVVVWVMTEVV